MKPERLSRAGQGIVVCCEGIELDAGSLTIFLPLALMPLCPCRLRVGGARSGCAKSAVRKKIFLQNGS